MFKSKYLSIEWQASSQLDNTSLRSLTISLLRGLAAIEVAAAHLRAEIFPGLRELGNPPLAYQLLAFATGFAHQAVVVFFVISGWLVGGSLLNKLASGAPTPLRSYAVDRCSRLWTVLLPALLLMLAVGAVTGAIDTGTPDAARANAYSLTAFVGNLFGLQTVLVDNYAGNYALWSLSNETWYYVQFPLLVLTLTPGSPIRQLAAASALVLLVSALPLPLSLYFGVWLLGVLFSRLRIECGRWVQAVFAILLLAASAYFRIKGNNDDLDMSSLVQDVVISLPLLAWLASLQSPFFATSPARRRLARIVHLLSEFSFTLYVTHIPLIWLMRHLMQETSGVNRLDPHFAFAYAGYAGMLALLLTGAYLSYLVFESQTFRVRRVLKSFLLHRAPGSVLSSSTPK